jgi:dTDP-4-dehydrorhamnose 3,5-epimerase
MRVVETSLLMLDTEPRCSATAALFYVLQPARHGAALGLDAEFVQDNHSRSARQCAARPALSDQTTAGQAGARVAGSVYDGAVDLRRPKTFGQWVGFELSTENKRIA